VDGSSASLIAIPIMVTLALAVWLILVAYAATHPWWAHRTRTARQESPAPGGGQLRVTGPRPAGRPPVSARRGAIAGNPGKLAA
jgi:hypothetical protein